MNATENEIDIYFKYIHNGTVQGAMKARRGSRGVAVLFFNLCASESLSY